MFKAYHATISVYVAAEAAKQIRNGQRLRKANNSVRKGEMRPNPFGINLPDKLLPIYSIVVVIQLFRMRICGAYSRKYDKPRKFRKKRTFCSKKKLY
jgi:hypothetical protein